MLCLLTLYLQPPNHVHYLIVYACVCEERCEREKEAAHVCMFAFIHLCTYIRYIDTRTSCSSRK